MSDQDQNHSPEWQEDYERVIDDARSRGEVTDMEPGEEKRKYPRINLHSRPILVHEPTRFQISTMSASGMAFFSEVNFEVGKILSISLEGLLTIEARVLVCAMEETDADFLEVKYRVRCEFSDVRYGMRFLVLALQSESSRIGINPLP